MDTLAKRLRRRIGAPSGSIDALVVDLVTRPTGMSSSGYPYLEREAWQQFRDRVPHILAMGQRLFRTRETILDALSETEGSDEEKENVRRACRVIRQVAFTAAITAPTDLWLLRYVLGFFDGLGLLDRLLAGEAIYPRSCLVEVDRETRQLYAEELEADLHFLLSRGFVEQYDESFRMAGHPRVREVFEQIGPTPHVPTNPTDAWQRVFSDDVLEADESDALAAVVSAVPRRRTEDAHNHWIPTRSEIEFGWRLVPIVLAARASGLCDRERDEIMAPEAWTSDYPELAVGAFHVLQAAGWVEREESGWRVTAVGARGFARGPGPFGIIETYHPYMTSGREILLEGTANVWVRRGENVGASQDANRGTFRVANDALDAFCEETGFDYDVFIEHAIGRGEATRQRYQRSGDDDIAYFGADLEDAAIDAAMVEQQRGNLPPEMVFVRNADIGEPDVLIEAIEARGESPHGAVMLVGNGFHEVRDQTDAKMVDVFRGYREAGIVLLFTEENALSIDDLRATAYNTYHAGFKYVHEKSGQGLRPAHPRPKVRLGRPLRAAWSECAEAAGYVRLERFCRPTRTIYPYTPPDGHNPSISVNHLFVPASLVAELGLRPGRPPA